MHKNYKINFKRRIGDERKSFRDRIRDRITRITKRYGYVVEQSKEPDGNKEYLVVYECETARGCNYQRVFKGPLRDCRRLAKALNNANNKEGKKDE